MGVFRQIKVLHLATMPGKTTNHTLGKFIL